MAVRMTRANFILGAAVILSIAATPGLFAGPANAQKREVTMRLDWLYQGPNAGFMIAQDKGFYDEAGLNVDIGPGNGSGSTAQLVASKASQFGFADGFVVGTGIAKGMNIRMVARAFTGAIRPPSSCSRKSDIKTPKDLEGKTIAIPTGATQFQQWPAFVKGCNLDASKIRVANVDPAGAVPALVTGKVQAIAGYAQGDVPSVEIRGNKKARYLLVRRLRRDGREQRHHRAQRPLQEDPELIRAFVKASLKGFLYARQHPDEAVEITRKFSEAMVPAIARRELELSWNTWVTPNTAGKPLGWMSDKDWDETVRVAQAIWRRHHAAESGRSLHQRLRADRQASSCRRNRSNGRKRARRTAPTARIGGYLSVSPERFACHAGPEGRAGARCAAGHRRAERLRGRRSILRSDRRGRAIHSRNRHPTLVRLIEHARDAGVLVVFIQAIYDPQYLSAAMRERNRRRNVEMPRCITGSWGADFHVVRPAPGEPIVIKHRYSAFTSTELNALLQRRGIGSLLLTGVATDTCVESTGRDAYFIDYYVTLVADCCGAFNDADHQGALERFDRDYGAIVNADDLIAVWRLATRQTNAVAAHA